VPRKDWPTLLAALFHNINSADIADNCKVASLEALGYMCDSMNPETVDETVVNQILSSIIDGMRSDRCNEIRLAAVKALNNSLDFTSTNFENAVER
jgi:importin subunit beta-1